MTKSATPQIYENLSQDALLKMAISRGEGVVSSNGALAVETGSRTGRSPKDRFIVKDDLTERTVDWGLINQPVTVQCFDSLWDRVEAYLNTKDALFVSQHCVGADTTYQIPLQLTCELAWHGLVAKNLFICDQELRTPQTLPWTVLCAPNFQSEPARDGVNSDAAVILNFTKRRLLICGTHYAGEIKKGMFTVMNFLMPEQQVLPMHCAANQGAEGDVALFFGLSGTGKTTLSTDHERFLIGDDEHGWSPQGVFNFEGGCYAKCINLSKKNEPDIWHAIRHGAVMENVILDPLTKDPCYDDAALTQNTRVAYPLSFIDRFVKSGNAAHPNHLIFLSCDLYGVLPPVARLNKEQAAYYFLSGYTALVGSTEVGSDVAIKPTFSACFGAPFFPRPPLDYAHLLMAHIEATNAGVYLVNTGWSGGPYGKGGERFSIPTTRSIVHAILNGYLEDALYQKLPGFNFEIPDASHGIHGLDAKLLDPRRSWENPQEYDQYAARLIQEFQKNFEKFDAPTVKQAGPVLL
ncbi:MAG: phosphoenolpyruvate carboxykinase (ATP) [Alphaproteobacteria bacterium]|jgi:phosphoenolpyruvate carboxykinase (ATP)|nr:phosphoenolpyruvate carboxykinase (ATP) [Alphaproteobacteria bacterium]